MVKITDDMARFVAIVMLAMDPDPYQAWEVFTGKCRDNNWTEDPSVALGGENDDSRLAARVINNVPHEMSKPRAICEMVLDQLGKRQFDEDGEPIQDNAKDTAELIDQLAETLSSPYARNALSGEMLAMMRKNILIPDEHKALTKALKDSGMVKCTCGAEYAHGEGVTWVAGGGSDAPLIQCRRCQRPTYSRCRQDGCDRLVALRRDGTGEEYCYDHVQERAQVAGLGGGGGGVLNPNATVRNITDMLREVTEPIIPRRR